MQSYETIAETANIFPSILKDGHHEIKNSVAEILVFAGCGVMMSYWNIGSASFAAHRNEDKADKEDDKSGYHD